MIPEGSQPRTEKDTDAELGIRLALTWALVLRGVRDVDDGAKNAGRWALSCDCDRRGGVGVLCMEGFGDGVVAATGSSSASSGCKAAEREDFFVDFFFFFLRLEGSEDRVFFDVLADASL